MGRTFCLLTLFLLLPLVGSADQPNVVLILADDMGWGDPRCYNPESKIPTPGIDRLAAEGVRFTDAHTPSSVCTPTRYGLLTGRYCWRTRLKSSVLDGFSPPLIEHDRPTIASLLKQQGYATACIGKWHLGMQWTRRDGSPETDDRAQRGFRPGDDIDFSKRLSAGPLTVGFDHFFGISASLDMPPYCWIVDDRCMPAPSAAVPTAKDTIFLNQTGGAADPEFKLEGVLPELKRHAVDWIQRHHRDHPEQPFFLYLPLNSPHLPVAPSQRFKGTSSAGDYGDFVVETDDCVSSVLNALDETGKTDNTLVIFTSDNGGLWHAWDPVETDDVAHYQPTARAQYTRNFGHQSNAHLRGTKADIWEGGHRVPFLARWPNVIQPGSVSKQLVELTDVMATVADAVGQPRPDSAQDSHSMLPILKGGQTPTRSFAIHHSLRGEFAFRQGRWKYMPSRGSGGFSRPRAIKAASREPTGQLYDLAEDPSETRNLFAERPQEVSRLKIALGDVVDPLDRQRIQFTSTADGTTQEAIVILPDATAKSDQPRPVVVSLHSWSADLNQRNVLERLVHDRGWIYLFPNFRGVNRTPQACGSELAQQDILDSVDVVLKKHNADSSRVYLTGSSGGGHMTMLMAARYPKRWKAASAWVGISDLVSWHGRHRGSKYGDMLELCCGGPPGASKEVDSQYRARSPLTFLSAARGVPIDIAAGVHDGHTGSVPIRHSIAAYNEIARANGQPAVSESEITQLSRENGRLTEPGEGDTGFDESFGREYHLRRRSGQARLTIFEGGHEGIGEAAVAWFERHP